MTRADILAMPAGRELDVLLAVRLFGLDPAIWSYCGHDRGCGASCCEHRAPYGPDGMQECRWCPIPRYSTRIETAWEVVGRMRATVKAWADKTAHYGAEFMMGVDDEEWEAGYAYPLSGYDAGWVLHATADTAPLAIARAALASVMEGA